MSISPSSITVLIQPNSNSIDVYSYKVIGYSSNTSNRYGTYIPSSNTYIFTNTLSNYYNSVQSNIASNLNPNTLYYFASAARNKYNSNYGPFVDSRLNINSNLRYTRTGLPDPPLYIDSVVFNNLNSIYPNYGISANFITNGTGSNVIYTYNSGAINFNIINGRPIGIHTSNNTGSTNSNIMQINIKYNGNNDIVYNIGGYTQTSNNASLTGVNTILNISNIRDAYSNTNYTGFYRIFDTSISYFGSPSSEPIQLTYTQQFSDGAIKSNTLLPFSLDNLNSIPIIDISNNYILDISNNITYATGIPTYSINTINFNDIKIDHLYTNFFPTGKIITFDIFGTQNNINFSNSIYKDIYDLSDNTIIVPDMIGYYPNTYDLPIYLKEFNIPIDINLYSPVITSGPTINFTVNNIFGTFRSNYSLSNTYFDINSAIVANNTQDLYSAYGQRILSGYYPTSDGTFSNEYYSDFNNIVKFTDSNNNTIYDISGSVPFDNTIDLTNNSNYYYELPLFNGYFQTHTYSNGTLSNNPYRNYCNYNCNYSCNVNLVYPNYSNLVTGVPNGSNMFFRYITFKYTINPYVNPITNTGYCMIQFINNNFTMGGINNYTIGYSNNSNYYSIKYKIISTELSTFESKQTQWISLQDVITDTGPFDFYTNSSLNAGLLANIRFRDTSSSIYTTSRSNRIFNIPLNIGVTDTDIIFDMYIRVGIPRDSSAGFQYISTCFSIIPNRT
jgi:hypothetical protein